MKCCAGCLGDRRRSRPRTQPQRPDDAPPMLYQRVPSPPVTDVVDAAAFAAAAATGSQFVPVLPPRAEPSDAAPTGIGAAEARLTDAFVGAAATGSSFVPAVPPRSEAADGPLLLASLLPPLSAVAAAPLPPPPVLPVRVVPEQLFTVDDDEPSLRAAAAAAPLLLATLRDVYADDQASVDGDDEACGIERIDPGELQISANYQEGPIPPDPIGDREDRFNDDDTYVCDLARWVVQRARELIPFGPVNNRGALPDEIRNLERNPWRQNAIIDATVGEAVEQGIERQFPGMQGFTVQLACLAWATRARGIGVCSKIATVCFGLVSMSAEPDTIACQVFVSADHEFVVVRRGNSRWWVIDPWVMNVCVIPFSWCYFRPATVTKHISMIVNRRATYPFGVALPDDFMAEMERQMEEAVGRDVDPDKRQYGHQTNAGRAVDASFLEVDAYAWGPVESRPPRPAAAEAASSSADADASDSEPVEPDMSTAAAAAASTDAYHDLYDDPYDGPHDNNQGP
jgi:hypothetical protein